VFYYYLRTKRKILVLQNILLIFQYSIYRNKFKELIEVVNLIYILFYFSYLITKYCKTYYKIRNFRSLPIFKYISDLLLSFLEISRSNTYFSVQTVYSVNLRHHVAQNFRAAQILTPAYGESDSPAEIFRREPPLCAWRCTCHIFGGARVDEKPGGLLSGQANN